MNDTTPPGNGAKRVHAELPVYRKPKQRRGQVTFEAALDAADKLIREEGAGSVRLHRIAERAGLATGSVYHFFPNPETVLLALVERYSDHFNTIVSEPIEPGLIRRWHDIIWQHIEKSRIYINANETVLILLIGPGVTWQTRMADTDGDNVIADSMLGHLRQYFDIPNQPDPQELLHLSIRILESFWQLSYQRHGYVSESMQQKTYSAMCAYLEQYWPRQLARIDQG